MFSSIYFRISFLDALFYKFQEHQSLAHCIAGGCASVATSFVFTPSERIKQQMQVGSHYHSCWYEYEYDPIFFFLITFDFSGQLTDFVIL